jgi:hypothetical protein
MTDNIPELSQTLAKIKSRGYWEVIVRPLRFERERLNTLKACADLVIENKVRLRGWDYPHVSSKYRAVSGDYWVENITDWSDHIEIWRMYQSGQFFHLFGCIEDWLGQERIFWSEKRHLEPGYGLSFLCTLYTLTEIYEFASRLAKKGIFDDFLTVSITLHGMKNRRLVTFDIRRSLYDNHICNIQNIQLSRKISVSEMIGTSNDLAIDDTYRTFERFNWLEPPKQVLQEEQREFLKENI